MKISMFIFICSLCFGCIAQAKEKKEAKTLFKMAGVTPDPATFSNGVLIIIDAQREYVDGALPLDGVDAAITETSKLLHRARKAGTPVVHVVHKGQGAIFNPDKSGFEIVAPLHPQAGEVVIEKTRISSFAGTKLEEEIKRLGRKNLIIVGFMTHNCVSSTARAARDLGYMPTIVAAATATRDLPGGKGGRIAAAKVQKASLATLADGTAWVVQKEHEIRE